MSGRRPELDEQHRRLDRLRRQVAEQSVRTHLLRLDSTELRAASAAIVDQTIALRLAARALTSQPVLLTPTRPVAE